MSEIDIELERLAAQVTQKQRWTAKQEALEKLLDALNTRRHELTQALGKEKGDVERLEARSLNRLWLSLTGKLEDQLDAEQREALAVQVRLEAVEKQIEELTKSKEARRSELSGLSDCERQYAALIARKEAYLRSTDLKKAEQFHELDNAALKLYSLTQEIDEAMHAGRAVMAQIDNIRTNLNSAEEWGTWDLLGGGGIVTHAIKHSHLDDAQAGINHLQVLLNRFHTELTDVQVSRKMTAEIDGFLRFADWFFDGLFTDWAVLSRIKDSQQQLYSVERDVEKVLDQLSQMRKDAQAKKAELERERSALINENL